MKWTFSFHVCKSDRAIGTLTRAALIAASLTAFTLFLDSLHTFVLKGQLKTATDAGALAGARALLDDDLNEEAIIDASAIARSACAQRRADEIPVADNSPDTSVRVVVNAGTMLRTVAVTASRTVPHYLGSLFGVPRESVTTTSVAWTYKGRSTLTARNALSIAISLGSGQEKKRTGQTTNESEKIPDGKGGDKDLAGSGELQ